MVRSYKAVLNCRCAVSDERFGIPAWWRTCHGCWYSDGLCGSLSGVDDRQMSMTLSMPSISLAQVKAVDDWRGSC